MHVALTGATGLIGSAVLRELLAAGHEVTALVRSESSAHIVADAGATAAIGELGNTDWVRETVAAADGAVHLASPGDASSADLDSAVATAVLAAYAGTAKPYVHTGGVWVHGAGDDITETTTFDPPPLTAWREAVESRVLSADVRAAVVEPGIVYGEHGEGLPSTVTQPDADGRYHLIGDGTQRWTTVSSDQIARLYRIVLENPEASGYVIGVNDDHPTVREIAEAAAGGAEIVAETPDESRARLFAPLVDALLLDQVASNAKARRLGWDPSGPSLVEVLRAGRG